MSATTDRFMKAGIPRSCWAISAEATGRGSINTWALGMKERAEQKGALLSAYVLMGGEERKDRARHVLGIEHVELLARQACVNGQSVKLVPFYKLVHNLDHPAPQDEADDYSPLVSVLAVPYVPTPDQAACSVHQYVTAIDHLLEHIYDGGALIIGGNQTISKHLKSGYPAALERMLVENAELFEV